MRNIVALHFLLFGQGKKFGNAARFHVTHVAFTVLLQVFYSGILPITEREYGEADITPRKQRGKFTGKHTRVGTADEEFVLFRIILRVGVDGLFPRIDKLYFVNEKVNPPLRMHLVSVKRHQFLQVLMGLQESEIA